MSEGRRAQYCVRSLWVFSACNRHSASLFWHFLFLRYCPSNHYEFIRCRNTRVSSCIEIETQTRSSTTSHPQTSLPFCRNVIPICKWLMFLHSSCPMSRILCIVICSFLNKHSATLKKVNEMLRTLVDVKSKWHRLLLYTKSVDDYNTLLAEVKNVNLPYTYPFPDAVQPRHVFKGNSPKVPIQETQADLKFRNYRCEDCPDYGNGHNNTNNYSRIPCV